MSNTVESLTVTQQVGIFMFMLGAIPILGTSISTTLVLMNIHGGPAQPAPVVGYVFTGTMIFSIAGCVTFTLACFDWREIQNNVREVFSR